MQEVTRVLDEVKGLYRKVLGTPAPEIDPRNYLAFPPGVDPLNHAIEEAQQLQQLTQKMPVSTGTVAWVPVADSFAAPDAYVIRVEIPGVSREDLKVQLAAGECVVTGKRRLPEGLGQMRPLTVERPFGPFQRRFALPPGSNADKVSAQYHEGILELRITVDGMSEPKEMRIDQA